ncbi:hypothetical protein CFC21_087235, partial [Triticum aestivum]
REELSRRVATPLLGPGQPARAAPRAVVRGGGLGGAQHAVQVPGRRGGARGDGALPRRPAGRGVEGRARRRGGGGEHGREEHSGGAARGVELPRQPHGRPRRRRRGEGDVGRARLVVRRGARRGAVHGEGARARAGGRRPRVDGRGAGQQGPAPRRLLPPHAVL